jgi:hypothetical protein
VLPVRDGEGEQHGMKDQSEPSIPEHLQELLQPTPSGTAKLIAAWDGLTPETQIALLVARKKRAGDFDYFYHHVLEKALKSDNAFVRYMAVREMRFRDGQEREKAGIDNDPEPLVRYAHLETDSVGFPSHMFKPEHADKGSEFNDPEKYFALPHEARLAKIRNLKGGGKVIANLISYAVEHQLKDGRVSEMELMEILSDYLANPGFRDRYVKEGRSYHGSRKFFKGEDIEALWDLVLKVPDSLSHVIIGHLPEGAGLSSGIPKHVLEGMSNHQLETLLERPDVGLTELRHQKFREQGQGDSLRSAAIFYNFDLTNEEFAEIFSKPDQERSRELTSIAMLAQDLRLCVYAAIFDALSVSEGSWGGDFDYAKRAFENKLQRLKGWQRDKELGELKLYRLAVGAVPWRREDKGYPPVGELAFLEEAVVEGDTWATFVAFSKKWDEAPYRTRRLEKHLPRICEAGEERRPTLDEDDISDTDRLADRVANRLADLFAAARDEPEGEESKLAQALGKLSVHATVAQERTLDALNSVKAELADLSRSLNRQRAFFWAVIGLLIVMLFVGR